MKTFDLKKVKISKLDNTSIVNLIEYLLSLDNKSEVRDFLLKVADEFDNIDSGDMNEEKILTSFSTVFNALKNQFDVTDMNKVKYFFYFKA